MSLIIDGYNLLHASGIMGRGIGPGGLERSRMALLNFLADSLPADELPRTTVVFDAREAPPGLPRTVMHRGITVQFAAPSGDADEMIEALVRAESAPRKLTVVSSDHRLHRAARRRRARAVDSDQWYAEILRARMQRLRQKTPRLRENEATTEAEVEFWLREFGTEPAESSAAGGSPPPIVPEVHNPFPPGYGDDVTEDNA